MSDWVGKTREFIVTTEYEKDGVTLKRNKDGEIKRSFALRVKMIGDFGRTGQRKRLESSKMTVGAFVYEHLCQNLQIRYVESFIRTDRTQYYKEELYAILREQSGIMRGLHSEGALKKCAEELYKNNQPHRDSLLKKDLIYLLLDDLIFYQRPLRQRESLISECPYEAYIYVDKETGRLDVKVLSALQNRIHIIKNSVCGSSYPTSASLIRLMTKMSQLIIFLLPG